MPITPSMAGERKRKTRRISKITIPDRCHPLGRLVFAEMRRQAVTYLDMEWKAGVLVSTMKAWRQSNKPGIETIAACLGALGWELVPVPKLANLPSDVVEKLESVSEHFRNDQEMFGAALLAAAHLPTHVADEISEMRAAHSALLRPENAEIEDLAA